MTPNDLEILHSYYISTQPVRHERFGAPVVQEAIENFVTNGILQQYNTSDRYTITEKGKVFMRMILKTPRPVKVDRWFDPLRNKIIHE